MSRGCQDTLDHGKAESLEDFIGELEELKNRLKKGDRDSLLPFLEAYLRITRDVKESRDEGRFNDPEAMESLDLEFGRLYLEPVRKYLETGEKQEPWKNYLEYIEREDSRPLLELVLGINSHVNADLATAVNKTDYKNREDFQKINEILRKNLRPLLMHLTVKHRDLISLSVLGVPPVALKGLHRIREWRESAWRNAHSVNFSAEEVNRKTEENARKMIEMAHRKDFSGILKKHWQWKEAKVSVRP